MLTTAQSANVLRILRDNIVRRPAMVTVAGATRGDLIDALEAGILELELAQRSGYTGDDLTDAEMDAYAGRIARDGR